MRDRSRGERHTTILAFYHCLAEAEKTVWPFGVFIAVNTLSPLAGVDPTTLLPIPR